MGADKLQNHTNEIRGKEKKEERGGREEEKRKNHCCTLSFYNGYFGCKEQLHAKGRSGDNFFKNSATYTVVVIVFKIYFVAHLI